MPFQAGGYVFTVSKAGYGIRTQLASFGTASISQFRLAPEKPLPLRPKKLDQTSLSCATRIRRKPPDGLPR
jgi:hypothetical protein